MAAVYHRLPQDDTNSLLFEVLIDDLQRDNQTDLAHQVLLNYPDVQEALGREDEDDLRTATEGALEDI